MKANNPRMTAFNYPKQDKYNSDKNEIQWIDYIHGYFKDDPRAVVVWTLEKKIMWNEARINQSNVGVMHDKGITNEELAPRCFCL